MYFTVFICVVLISLCNCSDVFHEGSKITFYPNNSADFFGYSVAFHKSSLLVGAPKANAEGVVFECPLQNLEKDSVRCMPLKLGYKDGKQKEYFRHGIDSMWFGASLAVGPTGKILICAPRWSREIKDANNSSFTTSTGACYLRMERRKGFIFPASATYIKKGLYYYAEHIRHDYKDYKRLTASNKTILDFYKFAQAGIATKVTDNNIIIGAPGLLQWSGGIIQYTYTPGEDSISYSQKPTYNPDFVDDIGPDEYFGYSVESGVFEDGGNTLYVTGGPRGKQCFGLVLVMEPATLLTGPPNILARIEGPQLGAYFGASLCCLDVNGDGRTDLLVGAPNYVKWFDREALYDQGAVYVYLNKEGAKGFSLEYAGHVTGSETNGAKFGYGIADLGDIDADGFNDVVISAPWENNGVGAVYIYRGSKEGLKSESAQRIAASEAKGFGMSLTKGHDVDDNKCNDLVVGAYGSGKAYIYRCIPTAKVQTSIMIPEMLTLPQNTTNFTAQFCVSAMPLRTYSTTIMMELQATVSVDPEGNRATIADNSTILTYYESASLPYDNCESKMIVLKPEADLSRPIAIIFDVKFIDIMQDNPTVFATNAGRVSSDSTLHSEFDIQLARGCGEDLICRPWLDITLKALNEPYIPGAGGRLGATIKVVNVKEPAFGIRVNLTLPSPPKRVPSTCNLQGLNMTCDLPSPLNQNQTTEWEVEFEYTQDMREMGATLISAHIDDPVAGRNVSDHASHFLVITITPVSNINASGKAVPNATLLVTREKWSEGGYIPFVHYFQILNLGPSDNPNVTAVLASEMCGKASLKSGIEGCAEDEGSGSKLYCSWSVQARESLSVVLPLRFDLSTNEESLVANTTCKVTTKLFIFLENTSREMVVPVTTTFILEPALQLWIVYVVSSVLGILLVVLMSYIGYKCGYLSRKRHPDYKKLRGGTAQRDADCDSTSQCPEQSIAVNGSSKDEHPKPGCSSSFQTSPKLTTSNASAEDDH